MTINFMTVKDLITKSFITGVFNTMANSPIVKATIAEYFANPATQQLISNTVAVAAYRADNYVIRQAGAVLSCITAENKLECVAKASGFNTAVDTFRAMTTNASSIASYVVDTASLIIERAADKMSTFTDDIAAKATASVVETLGSEHIGGFEFMDHSNDTRSDRDDVMSVESSMLNDYNFPPLFQSNTLGVFPLI